MCDDIVKILDIPIYGNTLERLVQIIMKESLIQKDKKNIIITATSAHGMVLSKRQINFLQVLKTVNLNIPDGMPLVWLGRLKGADKIERCYGPHFMKEILSKNRANHIRHFYCGGKFGIADKLKDKTQQEYPGLLVTGVYTPPFRDMTKQEWLSLADMINNNATDIVWIGLGTPKQELFAQKLSKYIRVKYIITVGAAFDFLTEEIVQAPFFLQRIGLEWFFRMCIEPKRLVKRYISVVPFFIFYAFIDYIGFLLRKD